VTLPIGDRLEAEALLTDHYLDSLLAANDRHATDAPSEPGLDANVRGAAARLRTSLTRVHPSFRFEERLAARLAEVAAGLRLAPAAGGEGGAMPFRALGFDPAEELAHGADPDDDKDHAGLHPSRPLLIGGALTSAALSIAGAAYVAWRRSRAQSSPMARAVRAANENRALRGAAAGITRRGVH
jgi:hypothetical protein